MPTVNRRVPTKEDLHVLIQALTDHHVDYIVIGGIAMALHGFPRATRDVDLLLPVDSENNQRLLRALKSLPFGKEAVMTLRPESLDKGFSTAMEAEIVVDLLFVAADQTFTDYRKHIHTVRYEGMAVVTLDVDGMLKSKNTTRQSDISDRLKLGRLKNSAIETKVKERLAELPRLGQTAGAPYVFWEHADAAIQRAGGDAGKVAWKQVEEDAIREWIVDHGQVPEAIAEALCALSPGAVYASRQEAIRERVMKVAAEPERRTRAPQEPEPEPEP